jgi:hypothetical protein
MDETTAGSGEATHAHSSMLNFPFIYILPRHQPNHLPENHQRVGNVDFPVRVRLSAGLRADIADQLVSVCGSDQTNRHAQGQQSIADVD